MATNLLLSPADFTTGNWHPFSSVPTGISVNDNSAASVGGISQSITVPNDTLNYVFSALIPKTSGATYFPALDVEFGSLLTTIVVNTDAGSLVDRTGGGFTAATGKGIRSEGTSWRVWIYNTNQNQTTWVVAFEPAYNGDASGTANVSKTGATTFASARFEQGTAPPSLPSGLGFFGG